MTDPKTRNIRIPIVSIEGREATPEDYAIVWNAALGFLQALEGIVHRHSNALGVPVTATGVFTLFARMLAEHPATERAAIFALIQRELDAFDAANGGPPEANDDEAPHPLLSVTPVGNA